MAKERRNMRVKDVPIEDVRPYENNPRFNDDAVDMVAESISSYGFMQPVVVDGDGVIVVGHTRYRAAMRLGMETIPVVVADGLTPEQVKAYRIADNKVADFSVWDNKSLLKELDEIGAGLFTGFADGAEFDEVLDESDNSVIDDNEAGVTYRISVKTGSEEKAREIVEFCAGLGLDVA